MRPRKVTGNANPVTRSRSDGGLVRTSILVVLIVGLGWSKPVAAAGDSESTQPGSVAETRSDSLVEQDLVCDARGRAWIVDSVPNETSDLNPAGECSDGPWSTTLSRFVPVDGGAIPIQLPGTGDRPKPCIGTRACWGGIADRFQAPTEDATPSASLRATLSGCGGVHTKFDQTIPNGHCFGHSFTDCWPAGCKVTFARLQVRMRASRSLATNDTITVYSGGQAVWRSDVADLPGAGGTWNQGQEATFLIKLDDVLDDLDQGVDVSIQDDSEIDFMRLIMRFDCCASVCGNKIVDATCNGQIDGTDSPLGGWAIALNGADEARMTTTDAEGKYCFDRLQPGMYSVGELAKPGWVQTFPPSGQHVVEVASGDRVEDLDFGNQLCDVCPKPEGACCTRDGCLENTFAECQAVGGLWLGRKACSPEVCSERGGACCTDGGCLLTLVDGCLDRGGRWQGEGSSCNDDGCSGPLTVTATPEVEAGCDRFGAMSTRVTLTLEGGVGPFTCEGAGQLQDREPNDRQCVFVGMPPGTYTYGVKGGGASPPVVVENVQVEALFELSVSQNDPSNPACDNGTASVDIRDEQFPFSRPPYSYRWEPTDQTEPTAVGLEAGTYTVTVTDADGCFTSEAVTLICGTSPPGGGNTNTAYFRLSNQNVFGSSFLGQSGDLGVDIEIDDGPGVSVGIERRLTEQLGLEIGLLYTDFDVGTLLLERGSAPFSNEQRSEQLLVFHVGGNFHLFPSRRTDVYFGPFVGFLDFPDPPGLKADDGLALGLTLGFDVPLGADGWGLSGALRYIDTELDLESPSLGLEGTLDFDLLTTELGVSLTF